MSIVDSPSSSSEVHFKQMKFATFFEGSNFSIVQSILCLIRSFVMRVDLGATPSACHPSQLKVSNKQTNVSLLSKRNLVLVFHSNNGTKKRKVVERCLIHFVCWLIRSLSSYASFEHPSQLKVSNKQTKMYRCCQNETSCLYSIPTTEQKNERS